MEFSVRKAAPEDMGRLAAMWRGLMGHHRRLARTRQQKGLTAAAKGAEGKWRRWAGKWMRSRDGLVLVAEHGGKIIGYSLNHVKANVPVYGIRKLGHMSDLFVEEGYRSKGVGKAFRDAAMAWFRKKGLGYVSIAAHATNKKAQALYRGWGFSDYHMELRKKL